MALFDHVLLQFIYSTYHSIFFNVIIYPKLEMKCLGAHYIELPCINPLNSLLCAL